MGVEFNEPNFNDIREKSKESSSSLTGWFIKKGWAKDEKGANKIMLIVMIVCFALTLYVIFK